jgi:hypothetical protein
MHQESEKIQDVCVMMSSILSARDALVTATERWINSNDPSGRAPGDHAPPPYRIERIKDRLPDRASAQSGDSGRIALASD